MEEIKYLDQTITLELYAQGKKVWNEYME